MNLEPGVLQINLDDIIPNRFQPRIAFDEQGLKELSDSIKEHGIIQPLVLRKLGNKYDKRPHGIAGIDLLQVSDYRRRTDSAVTETGIFFICAALVVFCILTLFI